MNLCSVISQMTSNSKLGDKDRVIQSFNTDAKYKYTINGACGVNYKGHIHFFGGWNHPEWEGDFNYENQHFGFDQNGNFVKYENLDADFHTPQCINFNIVKQNARAKTKQGS